MEGWKLQSSLKSTFGAKFGKRFQWEIGHSSFAHFSRCDHIVLCRNNQLSHFPLTFSGSVRPGNKLERQSGSEVHTNWRSWGNCWWGWCRRRPEPGEGGGGGGERQKIYPCLKTCQAPQLQSVTTSQVISFWMTSHRKARNRIAKNWTNTQVASLPSESTLMQAGDIYKPCFYRINSVKLQPIYFQIEYGRSWALFRSDPICSLATTGRR